MWSDIDFLVRPDRPTAELVVKFGFASLGISPEDLTHPDRILANAGTARTVQLGIKPNRIDLITSIAGVTFEEAWESRVAGTLDGLPVAYIGREVLIRNKESTGRPQDLGDAQRLRQRRPPLK